MTFLPLLWWLLVAHALTDYVLQPELMARYKHPTSRPPEYLGPWWWHMAAHGFVNGGGVALVTGSIWLGVAEAVLHSWIDYAKCVKQISPWTDQGLHLVSKVAWAWLA